MEYLLFAVLLYFILRTTGNLVSVLRGDGRDESTSPSPSRRDWKGPSPRDQTGRLRAQSSFWGKNIEDARWRDLND